MSISTPILTNFTAGEMSPRLEGRVDISKYYNGCRRLENFLVHPHGGITRRTGFRFVTNALSDEKESLLVPFEFNGQQTYVLEFGEDETGQGVMRVFADHGLLYSGESEYRLPTPYKADDLERLRYTQSADVLILTHPKHPVRKLTRLSHDNWSLEDMVFQGTPEAWKESDYPSTVGFFEQRLVLAATPNEPGTIWFSRTGDMTDFRLNTREAPLDGWRDKEIIAGTGDVRSGKAGDSFKLLDGEGFEKQDGIKGQHPDGTTRYYRYKGEANHVANGQTVTITFEDTVTSGIEAIWDAEGNMQETYWECYAVGDRTEAQAGDTPLDDDAIEVTLSGRQANAIEFLIPRSRLWVGTAGGEWTVGGAGGEALSPENVKANHEGACGAARFRPESVGYATLYIQRSGQKIREMAYRLESDAYVSNDLTLFSEHIAASGFRQLAFAQEPDSILYCVRGDGTLAAMTYAPAHEVTAWSILSTRGAVETITSIYDDSTNRDQIWAVVRRDINGRQRRYIEFLEAPFNGTIDDAFFVDSGLTYSGPETSMVAGLEHLAGETVAILADGATRSSRTVSPHGTISLDRPASTIQVGLPYASLVQPMRLEGGSRRGTAQTKRQRITKVAVRFHQTLGGKIGPDESRLEIINFRSATMPMDRSVGTFSGDKSVVFPKGWTRENILTVAQDQPLPMTILLIVPTTIINE